MRVRAVFSVVAMLVVAACSDDGGGPEGAAEPREVAARPSPACAGETPASGGEERVNLVSGGTERYYFRHVPPAHDGTAPVPVVVDLHGYSEGAEVHAKHSQLGAFGDEQGFVTVTPHGSGSVPRWDTNDGSADLEFIGELLDNVEATLCVDTTRVYVTGLSNGAFMTSAIACAYADRVAAVAPVAGIREIEGCDPAREVPVVTFHGTDDGFVDFEGGIGERSANLPAPDGSGRTRLEAGLVDPEAQGPSIPEAVAGWADRNGCDPEPAEEPVAGDVTLVRFDCPTGAEVEFYRVEGGGHTWPGSEFSRSIETVVGPTTFSISANEVMWDFFRAHPLPE